MALVVSSTPLCVHSNRRRMGRKRVHSSVSPPLSVHKPCIVPICKRALDTSTHLGQLLVLGEGHARHVEREQTRRPSGHVKERPLLCCCPSRLPPPLSVVGREQPIASRGMSKKYVECCEGQWLICCSPSVSGTGKGGHIMARII